MIKADSKKALEILAKLEPLKIGEKIEFEDFLKGFSTPTVAHLTEIEPGKFWQFSLYWNSIHIQDVVVEKLAENLVIEVLGA